MLRYVAASTFLLMAAISLAGCATDQRMDAKSAPAAADVSPMERSRIEQVLDTLHAAAASADESTYFAQFAPDAVFLGTDPAERWTLEAFKAYAHPHFESGRGWAYTPSARTVSFTPDGRAAWFDEVVTSQKYGRCRGTGVVVRRDGGWRIAQYSLSLPIPNDMFVDVANAIKKRAASPSADTAPYLFEAGDYLAWNTDHTERGLRPAYPVKPKARDRHPVYQITKDPQGRPSTVRFFLYGQPSDKSNFGAHKIVFAYGDGVIDRTFFDVKGALVANGKGVHTVRRMLGPDGLATKVMYLGVDSRPIEGSDGVAEVRFQRDEKGRRVAERRLNLAGEVIPEHNGFLEARFAFDSKDYASYRRGYDLDGKAGERSRRLPRRVLLVR